MNRPEWLRLLDDGREYAYYAEHYWDDFWGDGWPHPPPRWWLIVDAIVAHLYYQFRAWILCRHGHNMVDNGSYGTPESGADHLVCTRCGYSWSHQYY